MRLLRIFPMLAFVLLALPLQALPVQAEPYASAYAKAIKTDCPLIVGVGCPAPLDTSWQTALVKKLEGFRAGPCIVVAVPDVDDAGVKYLRHVKTLDYPASVETIKAVLPRKIEVPSKKWDPDTQPNFQQRMNNRRYSQVSAVRGNC